MLSEIIDYTIESKSCALFMLTSACLILIPFEVMGVCIGIGTYINTAWAVSVMMLIGFVLFAYYISALYYLMRPNRCQICGEEE